MKHFLDEVSPTGVHHRIHISDDELITEEFTPTSVDKAIVDSARALQGLHQQGSGLRHAARVPINLWNKWREEWEAGPCKDFTWATFEAMKLNSSDHSYLRTGVKTL